MNIDFFTVVLLMALLLAPFALQYFVQRLPIAPACPTCRATTRVSSEWNVARWLSLVWATSRSECGACGWSGWMRWQWAARTVPRPPK